MSKSIAIVTGGSSGLGLEIADYLARKAQSVCLVARNADALTRAREKLIATSCDADVMVRSCNVADEDGVKDLFKYLAETKRTISHVFNVAGVGKYGPPDANTRALIDNVFEANIVGMIVMCTLAVRAMRDTGGTIVNVMSTAAIKANPMETVYCAAKWGARGYTESLRAALKGSKIHVVAVYPGGMNTPFWKPDSGLSPDVSKFMAPDEVASVICDAIDARKSLYTADLQIERV